ncbi:sulfatase-like hydrolase/transferase [Bombella sp. ESL0378]|uniref:sulfatase-like hydrolase/transferase n=1 Tax=Bombella sp. ESL0378 TaxID=2676442 RepID=UPI0012D88F97|nr:sulfatase-like hydrolase/transferase [Bombella sp. ESL0378]MUG05014.1 sulfatase-like hydrolase/transferase [Bombella sp. ESL0378]
MYSILKNNKYAILSFVIFILFIRLNIYLIHFERGDVYINLKIVIGALFFLYLLMNSPKIIAVLFVPFILSFSLFEFYLSVKYESITPTMLQAIGGTNKHEALSMLASNGIILPIILVGFFLLSIFITYKCARFRIFPFFISALIVIWTAHTVWVQGNYVAPERQRSNLGERGHFLRRFLPGVPGDMIYIATIFFNNDNKPVVPHLKSNSAITGDLPQKEKNIILVIGESAFANRHSTYGYTPHPTTPYMKTLLDEGHLCAILNAHSGANVTRLSVPMLLSFYEPNKQQNLYDEKNLIELARDHGYQTSWISSQEGMGEYARTFGYISEYSNFLVRADYRAKEYHVNWHDETLIPVITKQFSTSNPYNFFIIHIMGSHQNYSDYVSKEDIEALPKADPYDQSLHRTDRILHQIVQLADAKLKDYTLLYISDHGEIVNQGAEGHGVQYGGKDQYKIPFYIKSNTDHYCQQAEAMRNSRGQYSSIMTKFLILEMLGYKIKEDTLKSYYNHDEVLHSDGVVYDYDHLPHK